MHPRRTVLVVEDTGPCATTLEIALAQIPGVEVEVVATAEAAREAFAHHPVCAVVTDLNLPGHSGFELIGWVRSQHRHHVPIVVVSGDSSPDAPELSLRAGADAYFGKPFSPGAVRKTVEDLIHE